MAFESKKLSPGRNAVFGLRAGITQDCMGHRQMAPLLRGTKVDRPNRSFLAPTFAEPAQRQPEDLEMGQHTAGV